VTEIGYSAFDGCKSLTSINIPNSVTKIDDQAFQGCTALTSINIPNSVTEIGYWAFDNCTSLTSINIPEGVTTIDIGTFSYCQNLADVYLYANPDELLNGDGLYPVNTNPKFHVFAEYLDKWNEKWNKKYNNREITFVGDIKRMSDESITIPSQTYTGSALIPVVKDGEKTLVEGEDYTITLSEGGCTNVGDYTVTLTGKNPYYYKSAEKTFTINPAPVKPEENTATATDDISVNSNIKIWSFEKTIFVENASKEIVIVDMAGRVVKTVKPENSRIEIQLPNSGVYIVKTGLKTQKIIIQ
ncbi:MAG: leucine-rich repeat domain-containing protein, partial [Bacteroidales bacterium]|nr:leucine-rich repeat domain-containing protein [Bacteroidales bacterium]